MTYWSATGQKLATYQLSAYGTQLVATATGTNQYFGGKLIKNASGYVTPDRLGSIGKYFPYGQERPSATPDGKEKFATYFRDSETGLDYADQRYHQPGMGRFMTPDPLGAANSKNPSSWNQYDYSEGDPINNNDPTGNYPCWVGNGDNREQTQCEDVSIYVYGNVTTYALIYNCFFFQQGCPWGGGIINTQGQGASGAMAVSNFSNSGTKQDTIRLDLEKLEGYLSNDPGCESWLAGGLNGPNGTLYGLIGDSLIGDNNFGYGDLYTVYSNGGSQDYTTAAFGGWKNADNSLIAGLPSGTLLTVNASGAFFNATAPGGTLTVGAGNYTGGTPQAQAAILIHELAHLTGAAGFVDDASGSPAQNRANVIANDARVAEHCGGLINAFQ